MDEWNRDMGEFTDITDWLREEWSRVPTPTGKPMFGPSWYAVTLCDDCETRGFTDIKQGSGSRFSCKTCYGFAEPVAWEGKERFFMTTDEALDEYGKWRAKQKKGSHFTMIRGRMKLPI